MQKERYDTAGHLTAINDSVSGTISYTYSGAGCGSGCSSAADKVVQEVTPLGTISYTYDAIGRRTSMTVTGQPAVNYGYDVNNRLTGISAIHPTLGTLNFDIDYDAVGRRTSLSLPNGVTTNYDYDNASRLLNLEHLNPAQQLLDSLTYTYDANGNRISMNIPSVTLPLPNPASNTAFNNANQMLSFNASTSSAQAFTYDNNGNMMSVTNACGTTAYTWDARNRLIGINGYKSDCAQLTASYEYDALGRRIEKTINGRTIQYLYDGLDIVQEIENGVPSVNCIRTLNIDEPLVRIKADGTVRYYQTDALGSVIALNDDTGAVKTTYAYDSFGNVTISGESSDNPFQYTGRENDETGLYYYRARYYSPELQRFISEDPILKFGSPNVPFMLPGILKTPSMLHAYNYVGNNPVNFVDPKGLKGKDYQTGDLCIEKLKQRINTHSCPNEEDCTICCAEFSDFDTPKFLICESLCIGWLKSREKSGKCCK
jgi:RHS repeat-associated protein